MNRILKLQIILAQFIFILGSINHFVFEWSGEFIPIAGLVAVNESVWEHLKLAFWPLMLFSLIEYKLIKDDVKNFLVGITFAVFSTMTMTVVFFYTYTTIFNTESLIIDIISFYIFINLGQIIGAKIMNSGKKSRIFSMIALISLIGMGIIFILFTYFPPQIFIFQDSMGNYGIVEHVN